ncbi:MAG: hypothetical protein CM15mP32_3660 [Flavobacteriaceae bacterium]|nr:MAG: hypothetical protein CM15mP32_3660 [Flavobacteriaceae bacterium]
MIQNIALIVGAALLSGLLPSQCVKPLSMYHRFIEFDLKNEIYQHYQRLSVNFYKNNRTGDLMNRISDDVSKVRMYFGPALMYSINTVALFVIVISTWSVLRLPNDVCVGTTPCCHCHLSVEPIDSQAQYYCARILSKLSAFTQEDVQWYWNHKSQCD